MSTNATAVSTGSAAAWTTQPVTGNLWANTSIRAGPTAGAHVYWNSTDTVHNGKLWSDITGYKSGTYGTARYTTDGQHMAWTELNACVASWSAYRMFDPSYSWITTTTLLTDYSTMEADLTFGSGDVYTTIDDFTVASGNFTPTRIQRLEITVTTTYTDNSEYIASSSSVAWPATPPCDYSSACSLLYDSYLQSLDLPTKASIPLITPPPTHSPDCPAYYYYQTYQTGWFHTNSFKSCDISGKNVEVFYFPTGEIVPPGAEMVYSYAPSITFTSPSVYLKFDELDAISYFGGGDDFHEECDGMNGLCWAVGGRVGPSTRAIGTKVSGAVLTLAPGDVSSFLLDYAPADASSVASVVANGGPFYANLGDELWFKSVLGQFTARPLELHKLIHPDPTDYYLKPGGAPGCSSDFPQPQCSTIFEGEYRPILSLPSHVSLLQPAWSTCLPAIYGVYDPPMALSEASFIFPVSPTQSDIEYIPPPPFPTFGHPQPLPPVASINHPTQSTFPWSDLVSYPITWTPRASASPSHTGPRTLQPVPMPDMPIQPPSFTWPAATSAVTTLNGIPMLPNQPYFVLVPYSTLARLQGPPVGSGLGNAETVQTEAPAMPTSMDVVVGARLTLTAGGAGHTLSAVGDGNMLVDGHILIGGNSILELVIPDDSSVALNGTAHPVHDDVAAMLEAGSASWTEGDGDRLLLEEEPIAKLPPFDLISAVFGHGGDILGALQPHRVVGPSVTTSTAAIAKTSSTALPTRPKPISVARPTAAATTTSIGSIHDAAVVRSRWYAVVVVLVCML